MDSLHGWSNGSREVAHHQLVRRSCTNTHDKNISAFNRNSSSKVCSGRQRIERGNSQYHSGILSYQYAELVNIQGKANGI